MIWIAAYAAVAVFCWGWWFAVLRWHKEVLRSGRGYLCQAFGTALMATLWPATLPGFGMWVLDTGWFGWHGWRLPYLERLWRKP